MLIPVPSDTEEGAGMLQVAQSTNLALRFALELAALVSLSYWGFHVVASTSWRTVLGIATPLTAAAVWALFASPHASLAPSGTVKAVVQFAVFGLAAASLVHSGKSGLAALFAGVAVVNTALMAGWQQ
jgi:hypothetical protein